MFSLIGGVSLQVFRYSYQPGVTVEFRKVKQTIASIGELGSNRDFNSRIHVLWENGREGPLGREEWVKYRRRNKEDKITMRMSKNTLRIILLIKHLYKNYKALNSMYI